MLVLVHQIVIVDEHLAAPGMRLPLAPPGRLGVVAAGLGAVQLPSGPASSSTRWRCARVRPAFARGLAPHGVPTGE